MKLILSVAITAILTFIVGRFAPWWSIAIVAFVISLVIIQKPFKAFLSGFLGVFLMWTIVAAFINVANGGILANRIGGVFGIGENPVLLIIIGSFVGGLVGGFAALTASYLRSK